MGAVLAQPTLALDGAPPERDQPQPSPDAFRLIATSPKPSIDAFRLIATSPTPSIDGFRLIATSPKPSIDGICLIATSPKPSIDGFASSRPAPVIDRWFRLIATSPGHRSMTFLLLA